MQRGDVRTGVLAVLAEQPGHGYEIIQALEEKSGGAWRPSPGSIYPTLQQLEDEDLVRSSERDGKRTYELTDAGRAEAERRLDEAGGPPWENAEGGDLRGNIRTFILAFKQVMVAGTPAQQEQAVKILGDARKQLYRLLAED
jgi:DNA-binding PadR family transcriptional regulator